MTHVESASDVVHLHSIERWKSSPPPPLNPTTPDWEVENLWSQNLGRHPPQLRIQRFQILWSRFTITNMFKLLMLKVHRLDDSSELEVSTLALSTIAVESPPRSLLLNMELQVECQLLLILCVYRMWCLQLDPGGGCLFWRPCVAMKAPRR
jgi:hypothetical protein